MLVVLALVASACGGDDDSTDAGAETSEDVAVERPASGGDDDASDDAGDAEGIFAGADESDDDAMADDAMEAMEEEAAMADEDAVAVDATAGRSGQPATTTTVPSSGDDEGGRPGGFFAPPEPDEDELENNNFRDYGVRPFVETARDPLSTFALDVDTASYSVARQWLTSGQVPPFESVRVEEYVNSFDYDYLTPNDGLNIEADAGPSPFDPDNVIVRVGVQAERVANADRPNASLTFVIDTSGSMDRSNRLGLVKRSLATLTRELDSTDTVAIVTYSSDAQVILEPTSVADEDVILDAIDRLAPTGSTNLEAGLRMGYNLADDAFEPGGINRVVLASDGVANVGLTDPDALARMIRDDADRGVQLVTVGVGMGNFNDVVMEQLADQGDGFYAYVNDEREAEKLFGDDLVSTLLTVAIDGKIQVEFNPDVVEAYRLIGFENRAVLDDDFRNDDVDAGELGAGHQVTALYELELVRGIGSNEQVGTAQLRWEDPEERSVRETRLVLTSDMLEDRWNETDPDFRLAVTVAAFAEILRDSPHRGDIELSQVAEEAEALSTGSGPIAELAELVRAADRLR